MKPFGGIKNAPGVTWGVQLQTERSGLLHYFSRVILRGKVSCGTRYSPDRLIH